VYETENDNDVSVLMAVIETAADAIDTEGVIRLLCELTDTRKAVAKLAERNVELLALSDRLAAAIDAERASYEQVLANRDAELSHVYADRDEIRAAINNGAGIPQMVDGNAITLAVVAYRRINSKIDMIKEFRKITGLGLRESKEICEQVIRAMDSAVAFAKEAAA